jgi:hypothetical protein
VKRNEGREEEKGREYSRGVVDDVNGREKRDENALPEKERRE